MIQMPNQNWFSLGFINGICTGMIIMKLWGNRMQRKYYEKINEIEKGCGKRIFTCKDEICGEYYLGEIHLCSRCSGKLSKYKDKLRK